MRNVLIYAGTTEGRRMAQILAAAGINCHVCVATEYGKMLMPESENIRVLEGRLTVEQMRKLALSRDYEAVIDATHPFASLVSENIRKSLENTGLALYRLERDTSMDKSGCITARDVEDCCNILRQIQGNILLTTGSKDLHLFCQDESIRNRLVARILPGKESLEICYANGLEGRQIIAMQGPFSKEMNLAMISQYNISVMVTKESGRTGGVDEKVSAAMEDGIKCIMIEKPGSEEKVSYGYEGICRALGVDYKGESKELSVQLVGIGMGQRSGLSIEACQAIEEADYIFGARRMLEITNQLNTKAHAIKQDFYLAEDIIPQLEGRSGRAVILFSGDTGFYSGCEKMYQALREKGIDTKILPGTSSLSAFSARTGISWQDAAIVSCHGTEENLWKAELMESVKHRQKTFFLTSGPKDLNKIGEMFKYSDDLQVIVAYNLSYPDEKISRVSPEKCLEIGTPGLYVGMIINENPKPRKLTPDSQDHEFIRDSVPMTKEEVRQVSICKLGLKPDSIVYDVGSGSGSIAVEIAGLSERISVYAIETNPLAVELIKRNVGKFETDNVRVIRAMAPAGFDSLPAPTHAFIGGSKGNLMEILRALREKNPAMRVVINAISIETVCELKAVMENFEIENQEIIQMNVSRAKKLGNYNLMQANNPVYIMSFNFKIN